MKIQTGVVLANRQKTFWTIEQVNTKNQGNLKTSSDFNDWVKTVWEVVDGIPRGHVLTYGEVARLAGMSRAARRVSQAMRRAPREMKIPWHRVVNPHDHSSAFLIGGKL